ncbi:MAG: SAM-dependent methyltransferase [Bacteroidales bacterium]|nr:SAM-dependent methyltransferase [Bacteroidales bacterium]
MDELTQRFISEHLHDDVRALALKSFPARVDKALALCQIEARQLLRHKVPSWSANDGLLFPPHLSVEQSSSEATALYKASMMRGSSFVDLTGGLGVDCHFIAQSFQETHYVERNPELCLLAKHNFEVLGDAIQVHQESAESFLNEMGVVDAVFIDPARRDAYGRKTVSIADCTPDVAGLQELLMQRARRVMVKLSPMLDISKALMELHHVSEVHVVAVGNECKELLFIMEPDFEGAPEFTCVNLQTSQPEVRFTQEEEREALCDFAKGVANYLYEPNAALMKGGCFKLLAKRFDLKKLHRNSHLYTADRLVSDFPGRIFKVEGWAPYNKRVRQQLLSEVSKASIAVRNFPLSVAELRKTLRIADGDEVYLFATTLADGQKVIVKTKR